MPKATTNLEPKAYQNELRDLQKYHLGNRIEKDDGNGGYRCLLFVKVVGQKLIEINNQRNTNQSVTPKGRNINIYKNIKS